jgi:cytochrome P450
MSFASVSSLPGPSVDEVQQHLTADRLSAVPGYLCDVAERFGPLVAIHIGKRPYVLVNEPKLIRDVLVSQAASFRKGRDAVYDVVRDGLFTSDGLSHAIQREAAHAHFHEVQSGGFEQAVLLHARAFARANRRSEVIDVGREMRRLTLAIGAQVLFGATLDDRDDAIGTALRVVMDRAGRGIFGGLHYPESATSVRSFNLARTYLQTVARGVIAESQRGRGLHAAMSIETEGPSAVGDRVLTLLLASQESTAIGLTWALYLLAGNREIQDRLRTETAEVVGQRPLEPANVPRLRYAAMVFKEVLRLYPPAWILGRRTRSAVTLGGTILPRGAALFISPYVIQRSQRHYRNPLKFDPDRWAVAAADRSPYTYFPFGGGERSCIGERFVSVEATLVLTELVRSFEFSLMSADPNISRADSDSSTATGAAAHNAPFLMVPLAAGFAVLGLFDELCAALERDKHKALTDQVLSYNEKSSRASSRRTILSHARVTGVGTTWLTAAGAGTEIDKAALMRKAWTIGSNCYRSTDSAA